MYISYFRRLGLNMQTEAQSKHVDRQYLAKVCFLIHTSIELFFYVLVWCMVGVGVAWVPLVLI